MDVSIPADQESSRIEAELNLIDKKALEEGYYSYEPYMNEVVEAKLAKSLSIKSLIIQCGVIVLPIAHTIYGVVNQTLPLETCYFANDEEVNLPLSQCLACNGENLVMSTITWVRVITGISSIVTVLLLTEAMVSSVSNAALCWKFFKFGILVKPKDDDFSKLYPYFLSRFVYHCSPLSSLAMSRQLSQVHVP